MLFQKNTILTFPEVILLIVITYGCKKDNFSLPVLTTSDVTSISQTSATSGGNIYSDGGDTVKARGVCWSISANPTIENSKTTDGTGIGTFSSLLTGLTLGDKYFVRAYATNSKGTAYGNEINFITKLTIGDTCQGGIIAYILQPEDPGYISGETHGLIAAPFDQSGGIVWSNVFGSGPFEKSIGTGNANTNYIVARGSSGLYAAKLCYDLVLGNFGDWYLPSYDELNKLYINRVAVGGFTSKYNTYYWSSTGWINTTAFCQSFYDGNKTNYPKIEKCFVRAIRSF